MASRLFPHASLRSKIRLIAMAATLFALALMTLGYGAWQYESQRNAALAAMGVVAEVMSLDVDDALYNLDRAAASEQLAAASISPRIAQACLFDQDGKLFSFYNAASVATPCPADRQVLALQGENEDQLKRLLPRAAANMEWRGLGPNRFFINHLVHFRGQAYGQLYMLFTVPGMSDMLAANLPVLCVLFVVASGMALLLAEFLQKDVSEPITRLAAAMRRIAREKDYGMRMRKNSDDEIGALIEQFNFMLAEVENRDRELLSARIDLESLVLQRTEELEKARSARSANA